MLTQIRCGQCSRFRFVLTKYICMTNSNTHNYSHIILTADVFNCQVRSTFILFLVLFRVLPILTLTKRNTMVCESYVEIVRLNRPIGLPLKYTIRRFTRFV